MSRVVTVFMLLAVVASVAAGERWFKPQHAQAGRLLYLEHCASCHGPDAQGAPQWRHPNPDGSYPAPPLNGTGHAWHHPLKALYATISKGQGNMPGWETTLNNGEMLAIIAWFQSQWSDEIYEAWARMDRAAR